jgi:hypothetical protein
VRPRPAGADNFLRWRRSIDEHLELRRITWDEFGMFTWLCTKANARTGSVRTSWPTLSEQTGLTPNHVEKLCRGLKRKRYVWYPVHRGARGRLVDVAIHKYPLAHGSYTDLSPRFAVEVPAEVLADVAGSARPGVRTRADVLAEVPAELAGETVEKSRGSPPGRQRQIREKDTDGDARAPRARLGLGARAGQSSPHGGEVAAPVTIRDLLATQPWWQPSADDRPSLTAPEADRPARKGVPR